MGLFRYRFVMKILGNAGNHKSEYLAAKSQLLEQSRSFKASSAVRAFCFCTHTRRLALLGGARFTWGSHLGNSSKMIPSVLFGPIKVSCRSFSKHLHGWALHLANRNYL